MSHLHGHWLALARRLELGLTAESPLAGFVMTEDSWRSTDPALETGLFPEEAPLSTLSYEPIAVPHLQIQLHQCLEAGIVLKGQFPIQFEDLELNINPGEAWLCAPCEPHAPRSPSPSTDNATVVLLFVPEALGDEQIDGISWLTLFSLPPRERPQASSRKTRERILAIGEELREEIEEKSPGWATAARLGLLRLLFALRRDWTPPSPGRARAYVQPNDLGRIMPALAVVMDEPARPMKLAQAARACGISRSLFTQIFRSTMGMTFARFHLRARLAYVAHRLLTSSLPIETIACEAGFVDGSHLHRTFLRHYARTPGDYRAQALPHTRQSLSAPS